MPQEVRDKTKLGKTIQGKRNPDERIASEKRNRKNMSEETLAQRLHQPHLSGCTNTHVIISDKIKAHEKT